MDMNLARRPNGECRLRLVDDALLVIPVDKGLLFLYGAPWACFQPNWFGFWFGFGLVILFVEHTFSILSVVICVALGVEVLAILYAAPRPRLQLDWLDWVGLSFVVCLVEPAVDVLLAVFLVVLDTLRARTRLNCRDWIGLRLVVLVVDVFVAP
jgi:hypothetical protein